MSLPKSAINPGQYTYSYGDRVEYDISSGIDNIVRGKGTIVGVTSNYFPFMGAIYAVEADDFPTDYYPYKVIPVQESLLKEINNV